MAAAAAIQSNSQLAAMDFGVLKMPINTASRSFLTTPGAQTPLGGGLLSSSTSNKRNNANALTVAGASAAKFKLEPLKVLEPSQKKLSLPESQRIMFILEELIRKLEMLEYVGVVVANEQRARELLRHTLNDDELRKNVEHGFVAMCEHHRALVDAYSKHNSSLPSQSSTNANRQSLEALIKSSCKDLLRVMQAKPTFYESVKQEFAAKISKKQNPQIVELTSEEMLCIE